VDTPPELSLALQPITQSDNQEHHTRRTPKKLEKRQKKVSMLRPILLRSQAKDLLSLLQQQGKQKKEFSHLLLEMQKYGTAGKVPFSALAQTNHMSGSQKPMRNPTEKKWALGSEGNPLLTLHHLLKQKDYPELDQYFHSLPPTQITDSIRLVMIKSYYERNQPERIYMLYREITSRHHIAVRYYMESCIRTQRLGNALFALQSRRDVPLEWYARLLDACLQAKQWRLAYRVVLHVPHRAQEVYPHLVYHGYLKQAQNIVPHLERPMSPQVQRALLHVQVLKGLDAWLPYWEEHSYVSPWIKTLDLMIQDCRARPDVHVQVEHVVPTEYMVVSV
jgi:hypothetical protein